eukprot:SAG25_NODE_1001_length_4350_cov_1.862856_2_plen_121_part_00
MSGWTPGDNFSSKVTVVVLSNEGWSDWLRVSYSYSRSPSSSVSHSCSPATVPVGVHATVGQLWQVSSLGWQHDDAWPLHTPQVSRAAPLSATPSQPVHVLLSPIRHSSRPHAAVVQYAAP